MAKELLDYDPWTGIATYTEQLHGDDKMAIHQEVDVSPLIEAQKRRRIEGFADSGAGNLGKLYANLDMVTVLKLKKKGIDIFNIRTKKDEEAFFREIETNYPLLKATEMKGWRPVGQESIAGASRLIRARS